jgi:hypothetical protein
MLELEEAKKLGEAVTLERIREALVNRNFKVAGIELSGGYFLVNDISEVNNEFIIRISLNSRNIYDKLGFGLL